MLILASQSPRRAELLRNAGISFEVRPADVDERAHEGEEPFENVRRLAREKALAVLAVLLLGRWPEGDLPAWRTGVAVPWTPGQRRGRALGGGSARAARGARAQTRAQPARERQTAQIEDATQPAAPARTRASTPKRKRKNRS